MPAEKVAKDPPPGAAESLIATAPRDMTPFVIAARIKAIKIMGEFDEGRLVKALRDLVELYSKGYSSDYRNDKVDDSLKILRFEFEVLSSLGKAQKGNKDFVQNFFEKRSREEQLALLESLYAGQVRDLIELLDDTALRDLYEYKDKPDNADKRVPWYCNDVQTFYDRLTEKLRKHFFDILAVEERDELLHALSKGRRKRLQKLLSREEVGKWLNTASPDTMGSLSEILRQLGFNPKAIRNMMSKKEIGKRLVSAPDAALADISVALLELGFTPKDILAMVEDSHGQDP